MKDLTLHHLSVHEKLLNPLEGATEVWWNHNIPIDSKVAYKAIHSLKLQPVYSVHKITALDTLKIDSTNKKGMVKYIRKH